jgi:hypothetical protein
MLVHIHAAGEAERDQRQQKGHPHMNILWLEKRTT